MRVRLAPSLFLSSFPSLKLANEATRSMTPHSLPTFLMNLSVSSHFDPKLAARSVSVSFVCRNAGPHQTTLKQTELLISWSWAPCLRFVCIDTFFRI